jgi:hypothetical protein
MIMFPRSLILKFYKQNPTWKESGLRLGQAFHTWAELNKITNAEDKAFCDALYNAKSDVASHMLIARTDWRN